MCTHIRRLRRTGDKRDGKAHRRLRVAQETPIDFGEPLVLLDLGGAALAAQTSPFPLIEEARDDVLARATCTCTTT